METRATQFLYRENVYRTMCNIMYKCLLNPHRDDFDEFWANLFYRAIQPGDTPHFWRVLAPISIWPTLLRWPISRDDAFAPDLHKFIALPLAAIAPQLVVMKWPDDPICWAFSRVFTWRRAIRHVPGPKWLSQQN